MSKVEENRLRRTAERRGLRVLKSRLRDTRAIGYGTFMIVDPTTNTVVARGDEERGYGLTLDEVATYLDR